MKNITYMFNIAAFFFLLFSTCSKNQPVETVTETIVETPTELSLKAINPRIFVGTVIDSSYTNEKFKKIVKTEFNVGQSLWYARWGGWLGENEYDFNNFNTYVNWMLANEIKPSMHMLMGPDNYMPDWLIEGKWKKEQLDTLLQNMIFNIMETNDNKNKVEAWNVINELFDDDGTYRTNMIWTKLGWEADSSNLKGEDLINDKHPLFIRKIFTYCRQKTNKKLELRDFNIESEDPDQDNYKKHKAFYQLLKHMLNTNIPIDAVGIQGHISVGNEDWRWKNNGLRDVVKKFKNLGLDVYITELDIRIDDRKWTDALAQKQKEDYYNYIKQVIEGGATHVHIWGIQDGADIGWLATEHPLPWDENLNKKPAYHGILKALMDTK
jgi:GH35 family endo-1,4-beta-xylanase